MAQANRSLVYRGVAYDTGSNHETGQGSISRTVWSNEIMRREIDAVRDELNANSVTIYGTRFDRLRETVEAAVSRGLHVWLQPRLMDGTQEQVLEHLQEAAKLAESFRTRGADIRLTVGSVHSVQTHGIMPGEHYHNRMGNVFAHADHHFLRPAGPVDQEDVTTKLNAFLRRAAKVARDHFGGEITYSAGPFEEVDWSLFDYIGLTYYYFYHPTREGYVQELDAYRRWNKPIVIAEYGTFTYKDAHTKGLLGFDIVDRSEDPPTVFDGFVRDEQAQADFHTGMLRMFDEIGIHSVAVTEFIHPTHPHSSDPKYDLDAASMAITKCIRDDYWDHDSTYRFEPKESLRAIGRYYADVAARERDAA
ncbi:Glycosyl hydrolase family 53 [Actinopolyspora mzabensis]|uniref:Glycosyl hydrolase family 53 n=1 Tax=Actinopolyspora mzabensis TaxID=995066 RepID=A0A1G8Y3T1_ACTMZ|nr:glycosyl hydrolase 53 family protein [Actinopolyspora mzabensis]SDJ97441.1 Glycosyl hydrolase family 53 [Actinopolyspora mzabensis]